MSAIALFEADEQGERRAADDRVRGMRTPDVRLDLLPASTWSLRHLR